MLGFLSVTFSCAPPSRDTTTSRLDTPRLRPAEPIRKDLSMARGIFYVETWPSSPERDADYNHWYDTVHLNDVCAVDGFVAARRYAAIGGEGPYVAIYEIETDDLEQAVEDLLAAFEAGQFRMSDSIETDPPPVTKLLRLITTHDAIAS
jgi:hypothetical protein